MTSNPESSRHGETLTSHGYQITVDDGRDSFFALSIEAVDSETAWLMSDTAHDLENMR